MRLRGSRLHLPCAGDDRRNILQEVVMLNRRQEQLIRLLTEKKDWMTSRELAGRLHVTDRTIRSDVDTVNRQGDRPLIESNVRKGYRAISDVRQDAGTVLAHEMPQPFSCCQVILEQQGSIAFVFIKFGTDVRLTQRQMPADLAAPVAEIPVKIIRIRFPAFHIISGCPDHKGPDPFPYRFVSKIRRSRFGKGFGMDGGNFVRAAAAVSIFLVRMANLSFVKAVVCRFLPVL